jgi:hypothetical protein
MVEDQTIIRHCTESKDRLKDKLYYQGSILGSPAPTDGLRPDHVKNGWPGPITQTIEDGFFVGTNSGRNPDRDYYTLNPEAAHIPPPQPGQDDKDATEFFRRLRFFDPSGAEEVRGGRRFQLCRDAQWLSAFHPYGYSADPIAVAARGADDSD